MNKAFVLSAFMTCLSLSLTAQELTAPWEEYMGNTRTKREWARIDRNSFLEATDPEEYDKIRDILTTHDYMSNPMIGIQSGRVYKDVAAYMNEVEATAGTAVRKRYYAETRKLCELAKGSERTIYLQMGNEINAWHFTQTLREWAKNYNKPYPHPATPYANDGDQIGRNDRGYIGYFAEYFLAPAIAGINDARKENPDVKNVKIILGSLANAKSDQARNVWFPVLWNYEIAGTYAPDMKGTKVKDLVDGISIHYIMTTDPLQPKLERLYADMAAQQKSVYSTEELGGMSLKGLGAVYGLPIWGRYMDVWTRMGYGPEMVRLIYYCADRSFKRAGDRVDVDYTYERNVVREACPEASADHALGLIETFMPRAILQNCCVSVSAKGSKISEIYAYSDQHKSKKVIVLHEPKDGEFSTIECADAYSKQASARAWLFTESLTQEIPVKITKSSRGTILISAEKKITFKEGSVLICLSNK